jgi:apolipoprotein N-acyltransferase
MSTAQLIICISMCLFLFINGFKWVGTSQNAFWKGSAFILTTTFPVLIFALFMIIAGQQKIIDEKPKTEKYIPVTAGDTLYKKTY